MTDIVGSAIALRIQGTHQLMLTLTGDLTGGQMAQQPSPDAPPIAWHLWHSARWADRFQASFRGKEAGPGQPPDPPGQIWTGQGLAGRWGLDPQSLGVLETGMGMEVAVAVSVAQIGKAALLDYARRTFAEVDQAIAEIDVLQLQEPRKSIREYRIDGDRVAEAPGGETTVVADLVFYLTHLGRHIGMIEALRGAMLAMPGI